MIGKTFYYLKKILERIKDFSIDVGLKTQVSSGSNVKFKSTATVYNIQKEPSQIVIGNNCRINGELLVFKYGGKITMGNNVFVGEQSRIWSGNSLTIGNDVLISHQVNIFDTNSHEFDHNLRAESFLKLITNGHPSSAKGIDTAPVVIEDNVWISFGSSILKGVTIGRGAVIAANAVVTKDVEPFTLVAGNPAKRIKTLTSE